MAWPPLPRRGFDGAEFRPPPTDLVKEGSEATFMADVIEASREVPVIVDFWAPWCGPCKTLGPALEAAVTAAKGKVRMVKIDVDQISASPRSCVSSRSRPSSPSWTASPWMASWGRSRRPRSRHSSSVWSR